MMRNTERESRFRSSLSIHEAYKYTWNAAIIAKEERKCV
jgi:hypothetical protein